ncbi:unnamed protein product [Calypogeia fissa]
MSGEGTARYFWLNFVAQGRHLLESVSTVDLDAFTKGVNILLRVEQLYFHLTERGEKDPKYNKGLTEGKIANLYYSKEEVQLTVKEAIRLLPTHIYSLPGSKKLTKKLIWEVGVCNRPHFVMELPPIGLQEAAGEGPSQPCSVGLPTRDKRVGTPAAKGEQQAGAPTPTRRRTLAKVVMEKERPVEPPQPTATGQESEGAVEVEVVPVQTPARVDIDLTDSEEAEQIKVYRLAEAMLNQALHSGHNEFWAAMGLHKFSALAWSANTGTLEKCRQFIANSSSESTRTFRYEIDLSEKSLAKIFGLPSSDRKAPVRCVKWQSKKFSGPKDKNGYKLAQCIDPALVERLQFLRQALYIQMAKTTVPVALVREAEEVLGKDVNWAQHFHKQFHHELAQARNTKRTFLGSHLRIIFGWIREFKGGDVAKLIKKRIPASVVVQPETAPPVSLVAEAVVTPVVTVVSGAPPVLSQEEQNVAQIVRSFNMTTEPSPKGEACEANDTVPPAEEPEEQFVAVISHQEGRPVFNRVESSASDATAGGPPSNGCEGNSEPVPMEEDGGDRPRTPREGAHGVNGTIPGYVREARSAEEWGDLGSLVAALGSLSKRAFWDDLTARYLATFNDCTEDLFRYLPWLAGRVTELKADNAMLKGEIAEFKTRIEDMANSEEHDRLLKEKSSWTSSRKQLEEELHEAQAATEQAIQERNIARATAAKTAIVVERHVKTLTKLSAEVQDLRISNDQLSHDNKILTSEVERLKQEIEDLNTQVGEAVGERDEALQDAENAEGMKEGLLNRIAELEAKYLTPQGPRGNGKRRCMD